MSKVRCWCGTINNFTAADEESLTKMPTTYLIYGREHMAGPTPHLQIYIEFPQTNRKTLLDMKKYNEKAHWEAAGGNAEENTKYCSKEGNVVIRGTPKVTKQGKRSDLDHVVTDLTGGASIVELAERWPVQFIKYNKGIEKLYQVMGEHRRLKPYTIYAYGDTGVGKTRGVVETFDINGVYIKDDDGMPWMDGYDKQKCILVDEFTGKTKATWFNRLIDYAPLQLPVKGSFVKITCEFVVICSNYPFETAANMGGWTEIEKACVKRRIDKFIHVVKSPFSKDGYVNQIKPIVDAYLGAQSGPADPEPVEVINLDGEESNDGY